MAIYEHKNKIEEIQSNKVYVAADAQVVREKPSKN
jgi:hypothetical protein